MVFEIYDAAANYQGMQTGWFQKVVNDRFNVDLNIIAPQVAGDAISVFWMQRILQIALSQVLSRTSARILAIILTL